MPTPNKAPKRRDRARPGSAPDQPKRGRPNTPQTPAIEREIQDLQKALDLQINQWKGLDKSIAVKDAALQKLADDIKKKTEARRQQVCKQKGVEDSIASKIMRLKELNIDRSGDFQPSRNDSRTVVSYVLSDGSTGKATIDLSNGFLLGRDLVDGIKYMASNSLRSYRSCSWKSLMSS
jgi:hypothetical protein